MASSGKRGEAPRKQKIVFMPASSNPAVDSKKKEVRMMVSKYAMKNRPKNQLTPNSFPGDAAPVEARYPSQGKLNNTPQVGLSSFDTSVQSNTSGPGSGNGVMPLGVILNGSKDYYALQFTKPAQKPQPSSRRPATFKSRQEPAIPIRDSLSPTVDVPAYGTGSVYTPSIDNTDGTDRADTDVFSKVDDIDFDVDFEYSYSPTERSFTESENPLGNHPLTIVSTNVNPFDCMPVSRSRHSLELIDLYLSGSYLSPAFTQGSREIIQRVKNYRRGEWFPLAMHSKVLMHALMAYIETTPGLPVVSREQNFLYENVHEAYVCMRQKLDNEKSKIDDAVCMAVLLLLLTAQRLGDIDAFRRHAQGLRVLLRARAQAFQHNKSIRERSEEKWKGLALKIHGAPNPQKCNYCLDSGMRPPSRSPSPPSEGDELGSDHSEIGTPVANVNTVIPVGERGSGFFNLIERGYLTPQMKNFVEEILVMAELAEHTRYDQLSTAVASSHAWIDEQPGRLPPFDAACQYSGRLCLYLSTWLALGHSCSIVRMMSGAVVYNLRHPSVDIEHLLVECPLVLIWLCLIAGPFIEEARANLWITSLFVRARHAISMLDLDFEETINVVCGLFVWIKTKTSGARRFWNESILDVDSAVAYMRGAT